MVSWIISVQLTWVSAKGLQEARLWGTLLSTSACPSSVYFMGHFTKSGCELGLWA